MPQGSRLVQTPEGVQEFPADATDVEISAALNAIPSANVPPKAKARTWADVGKDVARSAANALPAIGGIVGGAVSGGGTLGTATIPGVALGVGAGRGLRDLITESTGLEEPTTPTSKAARIALDTGTAAATQAVLPGAIEAIRTPVKTMSEAAVTFRNTLPPAIRALLPKLEGLKAPTAAAPIMQRPAWQNRGAAPVAAADKVKLSALDMTRIKYLVDQGIPQGDAYRTIVNLKVKGGL